MTKALDSFRRIISSGAYIPEIDGLRFLAILSVVLLHTYGQVLAERGFGPLDMDRQHGVLRLLSHGSYGVELFFAISGFILGLPFASRYLQAGRPVNLGSYFLRRLTRLEPPYILMLLLRAAALAATASLTGRALVTHLLASVFYVHNIAYGIASKIESVSWTLEIEVQFYCLAPLLTLVYRIPNAWLRRGLLLLLIAAASPLQAAFLPGWYDFRPGGRGALNLSIVGSIQFFLVGLLVADLYAQGWGRIPKAWTWDVISLSLWYLLFWLPYHGFRFMGPLILPILFVGAFKGRLVPAVLRNPVVCTIGGMCYSIYLTHRTTILLSQRLLAHFHLRFTSLLALSLLVAAPASIAVGGTYFLVIERPCMDPKWPRKLLARFRSLRVRHYAGRCLPRKV